MDGSLPCGLAPSARLVVSAGTPFAPVRHFAGLRNFAITSTWPAFLILALASAVLLFSRVSCPLLEPDEARYAEIPREMLVRQSWVVPVLHGQAYHHKPPLLYWLVMGCYGLFGVHDWAARLVPCSVSFLVVVVTYFWGRQTGSRLGAFAGAIVLCLSGRFVYCGPMLTMDSLLCLCVVTAWAAAHLAVRGPSVRWAWWFLSAVACGLGVLTKGPVALVLVGVPVLVHELWTRRWRLRTLPAVCHVAVAVGVALPWYMAVALRDGGFAGDFFWTHNVRRFLAPLDHQEPFWFYVPGLLLGMMPWTLLLPSLLTSYVKRANEPGWQEGGQRFFMLACAGCLLFYSASGCKRPGYILPAVPPLALMLGFHLERMVRAGRRSCLRSWALCAGVTFAVLVSIDHLLLPGYARKFSLRAQVQPQQPLSAAPELPVICYPHGWDSVSFYLQRNDVRAYGFDRRQSLYADLIDAGEALVFIKSERYLGEFLRDLPDRLEFVPRQANGIATAGLVRRRVAD